MGLENADFIWQNRLKIGRFIFPSLIKGVLNHGISALEPIRRGVPEGVFFESAAPEKATL